MVQLQYGRFIAEHYDRAKNMLEANVENNRVTLSVNCCGRVVRVNAFTTDEPLGRHDYYMMYMISGSMRCKFGSNESRLIPGSFVCIPPETPYLYINDGSQEIHYLTMHFTGSEASQLLKQAGIEPNVVYPTGIHTDIIELYESMFSTFRIPPANFDFAITAHVHFILYSLSRAAHESAHITGRTFEISMKYIHSHLDASISVEELASMEFLSPSRYRTLFRRITGYSPQEYITRQKIQKACTLLADTSMDIREIAEKSGYPDRLYFQRIFKKQTGMTPLEYRQRS